MTVKVLFSASAQVRQAYWDVLSQQLEKNWIPFELLSQFAGDPIDYIIYEPEGGLVDFSPYQGCKAVLGLWAGVESHLKYNKTLPCPFVRMVDRGYIQGMVEWVVGHVFRYHLHLDDYLPTQPKAWGVVKNIPQLSYQKTVGIFGLGEIGQATVQALAQLGFRVLGWHNQYVEAGSIEVYVGESGFRDFIAQLDYLVLVCPFSLKDRAVINSDTLEWIKPGLILLNPSHSSLIDDTSLQQALDSGKIKAATLDRLSKPFSNRHPLAQYDQVTVTPRLASLARTEIIAQTLAQSIKDHESGKLPDHVVQL